MRGEKEVVFGEVVFHLPSGIVVKRIKDRLAQMTAAA